MTGARRALAFLTPVGGARPPEPGALNWFPVVGAALGAALGVVWWAVAKAWPAGVAAAVVVAADLALTGMLHFDGLVDAADGLLPHLPRSRRLQVMREPTVGAYGVVAGGTVLLLRWAALDAVRPSVLLLAGLWAGSRGTMAVVAAEVPYARSEDGGLATAFLPDSSRAGWSRAGVGILSVLVAEGCLVAWHPLAGSVSLAAGVVGAAAVVWVAVRSLGGFTGDVLGAAGIVLETVALVVAAARW